MRKLAKDRSELPTLGKMIAHTLDGGPRSLELKTRFPDDLSNGSQFFLRGPLLSGHKSLILNDNFRFFLAQIRFSPFECMDHVSRKYLLDISFRD